MFSLENIQKEIQFFWYMNLIFLNSYSLLDSSSGAATSIRLMLEELSSTFDAVHVITSCVSENHQGYVKSLEIWKRYSSDSKSSCTRFKRNGLFYSLIRTDSRERLKLNSSEAESIYREFEMVSNALRQKNSPTLFLTWGNLLLEEACIRRAKGMKMKTIFYLVNPSYKDKNVPTINLADLIITDSRATQNLYKQYDKKPFIIVPKLLEVPEYERKHSLSNPRPAIALINASRHKGIEPFLRLADIANKNSVEMDFIVVDSKNNFERELHALGQESIPENTNIIPAFEDKDKFFERCSIVCLLSLWHESGSRLILESHLRGVPVMAFRSGGTEEFMTGLADDLFEMPDLNSDLRVQDWSPQKLFLRIQFLTSRQKLYKEYSDYLKNQAYAYVKKSSGQLKELIHSSIDNSHS